MNQLYHFKVNHDTLLRGYQEGLVGYIELWMFSIFFSDDDITFFVAGEFVDLSKIYVDSWIRPIWTFHISPE